MANLRKLISFDIDGTLETGNPPGTVTLDMVRRAQEMGYIIGSCSDRPVGDQRGIWERAGITVDFTVPKHRLAEVREQFEAEAYFHIGDTNIDQQYALLAGFEYLPVQTTTDDGSFGQPWMSPNDPSVAP